MAGCGGDAQWYWAARSDDGGRSGLRFVIASGQEDLWYRVRREIDPGERCSWMPFGPADGRATLSDCFRTFFIGREVYGADLNRVVLELARVPAYAAFIAEKPTRLIDRVSNPVGLGPLSRESYDPAVVAGLARIVGETLGMPLPIEEA